MRKDNKNEEITAKNQLLRTLAELRGNPAPAFIQNLCGALNESLPALCNGVYACFRVKRCTGGDCYFNLYVFSDDICISVRCCH